MGTNQIINNYTTRNEQRERKFRPPNLRMTDLIRHDLTYSNKKKLFYPITIKFRLMRSNSVLALKKYQQTRIIQENKKN